MSAIEEAIVLSMEKYQGLPGIGRFRRVVYDVGDGPEEVIISRQRFDETYCNDRNFKYIEAVEIGEHTVYVYTQHGEPKRTLGRNGSNR